MEGVSVTLSFLAIPLNHVQGVEKCEDLTGIDIPGSALPPMICWRLCEETPGVVGTPRLFVNLKTGGDPQK